VNILLVAEAFPWPATGGGLIRLGKVIEAVSELGDLDLFTLSDPSRSYPDLPDAVKVHRHGTTPYPAMAGGLRWRTAWMTQRQLPVEVLMRQYDHSPRQAFEAWVADSYDVVWFSTAAVYSWMGRPRLGPTIIDLMDLEDVKARQRAALLRQDRPGYRSMAGVKQSLAAAQSAKNARDWVTLQRSVADQVDRVVLCSDVDVRRSGLANAVEVPNTFPRPRQRAGRLAVADPPVVLLQGSLNYAPNMDAVDWLVDDVAPHLWAKVPTARIRLVGKTAAGVKRRHRPPAVTVVGRVPDMQPELALADVAVVPLRVGSGTRLKILESFAHRIPVVSTTIGADGLDVEDGVQLLLADDPEAVALACQRILSDPHLRQRLVDAAEERYLERYEWSAARTRIHDLVHRVSQGGSGPE
jgi:glycosyltransferase involved in cell wall biosynthesis